MRMGVLCDLVIADPSDAKWIAKSPAPLETWDGLSLGSVFDPVNVATLASIARTGDAQTSFETYLDAIQLVESVSDEGPWVYAFSASLLGVLATLAGETRLAQVASVWGQTEEMQPHAPDAPAMAIAITSLAAQAQASGKTLLARHAL